MFPAWIYFPSNSRPPGWVHELAEVFASAERAISTVAGAGLDSDGVLREVGDGLRTMGFEVEAGKTSQLKISRPVLFGERGTTKVPMDVDAFHDELGIALEVEAGRAWNGNAVYRDIVRASLLLDARQLALAVPLSYFRTATKPVPVYEKTSNLLSAIYASQRLRLPFDGVLVIGY